MRLASIQLWFADPETLVSGDEGNIMSKKFNIEDVDLTDLDTEEFDVNIEDQGEEEGNA